MDAVSRVTHDVVERFLQDRLGHWLAHDVAFLDRTTTTTTTGRGEALLALELILRGGPASGCLVTDAHILVDAGQAAAGWVVERRPDGDADVIVRVPMAATFEVVDGEIVALSVLYDRAVHEVAASVGSAGNIAGTAGS